MSTRSHGTIVQCIGAVIDIEFPREQMPKIYDALVLEDDPTNKLAEKGLTFEVEQQLGDGVVRTHRAGLLRRPAARHEGERTPARRSRCRSVRARSAASWTCSAARSTRRARSSPTSAAAIHQPAPKFDELSPSVELLETGIKVIDLICPFAKGGKIGLFGGAGVGKTVNMLELINNIAKQHSAAVGVRRRGRAHARGQRLLPRDVGARYQQDDPRSPRSRWCSAR